jgi:hypothetical protein
VAVKIAVDQCKTELQRLDTSDVSITHPLPAGSNAIGSVSVSALPLPANAATETTLSQVRSRLADIYTEMASAAAGTIKERLSRLESKMEEIRLLLAAEETNILRYSNTFTAIPASGSVTSGAVLVGDCSKTTVGIICHAAAGCIITVSASINGVDFFPIEGYSMLSINGEVYRALTFDSILPYIKLSISNPSKLTAIPKLYLEIRGLK